MVKVTDDGSPTNMSDTHTVTVTVTNVNEAPDDYDFTGAISTRTFDQVDENTANTDDHQDLRSDRRGRERRGR